jgi:hypothetical protein
MIPDVFCLLVSPRFDLTAVGRNHHKPVILAVVTQMFNKFTAFLCLLIIKTFDRDLSFHLPFASVGI